MKYTIRFRLINFMFKHDPSLLGTRKRVGILNNKMIPKNWMKEIGF